MADEPITELEINLLEPNPLQARAVFTQESLEELSSSIKEHGVLEPIIVAKTPAGYQIIAGERRWRASKLAGLKKVPVVIKETTSKGMLEMALVENVQREDLNPIDRGQAFQRLIDEFGLPVSEVAKRIGKSESYVSNTMRLLNLPDAIKDGLISGATTEGHARAISGLGETKLMVEAYKILLSENASVRRAEELARKMKAQNSQGPRGVTAKIYSDELEKMEQDITAKIDGKTKVKITQSSTSARLVIVITENRVKTTELLRDIHRKLTS